MVAKIPCIAHTPAKSYTVAVTISRTLLHIHTYMGTYRRDLYMAITVAYFVYYMWRYKGPKVHKQKKLSRTSTTIPSQTFLFVYLFDYFTGLVPDTTIVNII